MTGLQDALYSAMEVQVFTMVGPRAILGKERLCAVRWKCRSSPWLGPGQYWVKNFLVEGLLQLVDSLLYIPHVVFTVGFWLVADSLRLGHI